MHFFQANAMFFGWFSHFFEFRLHEYWVVTPPGEVALYRTLVQTHSWSQPTWLHCNCYSSSSFPPSPVAFAWVSTSYVFNVASFHFFLQDNISSQCTYNVKQTYSIEHVFRTQNFFKKFKLTPWNSWCLACWLSKICISSFSNVKLPENKFISDT